MNRKQQFLANGLVATALVTAMAAYGIAQSDGDDGGSDTERTVALVATGVGADASGEAQIQYSSTGTATDQGLEVHVQRLVPGASYTVRIDGVAHATVVPDASGASGVVFQNENGSDDGETADDGTDGDGEADDESSEVQLPLPAALAPVTNIRLVEVANESGEVVLTGSFAGDGHAASTSHILLTSSGAARGNVTLRMAARDRGNKESVLIQTAGLPPGLHRVLLNGVDSGTLKTTGDAGWLKLARSRRKATLPPAIHSVVDVTTVQIVDQSNQIELSGRLGS